ncbi:hypothetical protein B0H15DRAFT_801082 [Mycena belliarum]|uniref:Uncharacterized protein n=1 Tax=Mycena belliarum TaxID=1033014 RepID=A0AAD6U7P8_9AGAR|nr:hypothetical protein B0H15DRAFT_801082 [Mycena belliae]
MHFRSTLLLAFLAGASALNIKQARQDFTTGAPLTVPLASLQPSPTGTDAAIASAYAKYADDCGAPLAQALQDGLVAYNHWSHVPTTNISDPKFLSFVNTDYFPYMDARAACEQDEHQLGFAEADALRSSGVKSTKASVTGTAQSNTGAVGGGSGGGGGTGVASPTANPRASPSPSPNGADSRRRPGMLDLLTLLLGSAYLLRFV